MKLRHCHRHRHGGERAGDGAQERATKGPRLQKALFTLNFTHTLCLLSGAGTPDKNLCRLAVTPFFSFEVSKSKCFLMHPLNGNTSYYTKKEGATRHRHFSNKICFHLFCSKPFLETEGGGNCCWCVCCWIQLKAQMSHKR